ncbi:MAG TPA: hypothetical protein VN493_30985 [Thermoanaerobaculia bacterium]|nr:hypothetical protein [Thermoanaerobaculia bacterium]
MNPRQLIRWALAPLGALVASVLFNALSAYESLDTGPFSVGFAPTPEAQVYDVISLFFAVFSVVSVTFPLLRIIFSPVPGNEASPVTGYSATLLRVDAVLKFLNLFLPSRIMKEDAGDAREIINKLVADDSPTWMIYTKLSSSVCWILVAAVREVLTVTKKKPN